MSRLTQKGQGAPLALFSQSTDASLATLIGARFDSSDGREFILVLVGAASIANGLLVQSPAIVANHQNGAVATAAIGATSVGVAIAGTAMAANQYAGGFLVINAGTGIGQTLRIASHPASAAGSETITFQLEDPIRVATLVSDTKGCLIAHPCNGVIVNPTTPTGVVVGATVSGVTAANYALLQTKGVISLLSESLIATVGLGVAPSAATAGYGRSATGAGAQLIGAATQSAVSAEARAVSLDI